MSTRRIRKYESGAEKRKKKQRLEAFAQSQKGALNRFVIRETPEANVGDGQSHGDNAIEVDTPPAEIPQAKVDQGHGNTGEQEHIDDDDGGRG
jgi:hypothetical protein